MAYSKRELKELIKKHPYSEDRWSWEEKLDEIENGWRDEDGFPLVAFL